jgi:ribosomal protein S18 acetylase RimI-like enzyme
VRADRLRAAFDEQLRGRIPDPLPAGAEAEREGPLILLHGLDGGGFVDYRDLGGLEGEALDGLIRRCIGSFADRGEPFEWKVFGHDLPADLPERLEAAGFIPEERETVVIAEAAGIAGEPQLPDGVVLHEVEARADFDRIARFAESIWGDGDRTWLADMLASERAADPDSLTVRVVEADGEIVCAGWVRFAAGTDFASLWGGGTAPSWRRQGIYRALVADRARLAAERGFRFVQVDAMDTSRPILERLGFVAVTTTTPYIWSPD